MEFTSLKEFKEASREHSVLNGCQIKFVKNDSRRVRAICTINCDFLMYVSKLRDKETYRMQTLIGKHNCGRVFDNKNATTQWVAKILTEKFRNAFNLTVHEIMDGTRKQYSIGITELRAWKARKIVKDIMEGDFSNQYSRLWSYSVELRRVCREYLVFLEGFRPFIGVDGCHLKTKFGGQLLIAVGRDPNDQYFPLAFVVVENETKESWRWFLTFLLEDIGDITTHRWVFISDQQKGLIPVFEELIERTEHRYCLRHLYCNFKKKFGGGTLIRDIMMAAAKARYVEAWDEKMDELKKVNEKAYEWLNMVVDQQVKVKIFIRNYEDKILYDIVPMKSNHILLGRDKPIIKMFEWIRVYIMNRFAALNEKLGRYKGNVMPKPRKRLDREIEKSGNWLASWCNVSKFEVTHMARRDRFVVDLKAHSCSCNFWELVGIPCRHAVAAITYSGEDPELYVHKYYSREAYQKCYGQIITPINEERLRPKTNNEPILPPTYKNGPGRPKKLRIRDQMKIQQPLN
uniref:SWIM-type domain-containing protein n=1 Tax=Cajanus cajan TaxID=3821 RepID=A0A151TWJ0_CAJCA|nr:hypothetical protein KK1_010708 [Cajanus cajan]